MQILSLQVSIVYCPLASVPMKTYQWYGNSVGNLIGIAFDSVSLDQQIGVGPYGGGGGASTSGASASTNTQNQQFSGFPGSGFQG